jgi:hypothetical protein
MVSDWDAEIAMPSAKPAMSAMRTRAVSDTRQS